MELSHIRCMDAKYCLCEDVAAIFAAASADVASSNHDLHRADAGPWRPFRCSVARGVRRVFVTKIAAAAVGYAVSRLVVDPFLVCSSGGRVVWRSVCAEQSLSCRQRTVKAGWAGV